MRKIPLQAVITWAGFLLVGMLTGCASVVSTQVTNFNAWPADSRGASVALDTQAVATSAKWSELERKTYDALLERALRAQGLQPVGSADGERAAARFVASVLLDTRQDEIERSEAVYTPAYPWGTGYWGHRGWPGYWGPYYDDFNDGVFAGPVAPVYMGQRTWTQKVSSVLLTVRIADRGQKTGAKPNTEQQYGTAVFESSAQYRGAPAALPQLMPYLVQAAFDGFPGKNGQVRRVDVEVKKEQ